MKTNAKALLRSLSVTSTLLALASCGQGPDARDVTSKQSADASEKTNSSDTVSDKVKPPKEYYDALLAERLKATDMALAGNNQVLYVNFAGAKVKKGYTRGTSIIPCYNEATIPSSGLTAQEQKSIMEQVAQYYSNAGTKIELTYTEPKTGDYTTIHVGGRFSDLGCVGGASTLGMAPFDPDNANPNDIGFAFIPPSRDLVTIAQTIAHESGHSFGLDHTDNQADLMYPVVSRQVIGFGEGIAESSRQIQNSPALLQKTLGGGSASITGVQVVPTIPVIPNPSKNPNIPNMPNIPNLPNINNIPGLNNLGNLSQLLGQLSPALVNSLLQKIPQVGNLPGGVILQNPNSILALITILQNASAKQNGGTFDIQALLGLIGNPQFSQLSQILSIVGLVSTNPTAAIVQIVPMLIPGLKSNSLSPNAMPIDFAALLSLTQIQNPSQLIALLPQYSQLINSNFSGPQAAALMDLVKLAIASQYNVLSP